MKATASIIDYDLTLTIINDSNETVSLSSIDFESDISVVDEEGYHIGCVGNSFDTFVGEVRDSVVLDPGAQYLFKISLITELVYYKKGKAQVNIKHEEYKDLKIEWTTNNTFIVDDQFSFIPDDRVKIASSDEFIELHKRRIEEETNKGFFSKLLSIFGK